MNQQKVGQFLKQLRSEKAITQAELAERLGVSNRSVSRWENGTTMPDFDLLLELAEYYHVEVGEILAGERQSCEAKPEELMQSIAEYYNVEKEFFSKRMCIQFLIALVGMIIYRVGDVMGLSRIDPYGFAASSICGLVLGTLLTGLLYSSRSIIKVKMARERIIKHWNEKHRMSE